MASDTRGRVREEECHISGRETGRKTRRRQQMETNLCVGAFVSGNNEECPRYWLRGLRGCWMARGATSGCTGTKRARSSTAQLAETGQRASMAMARSRRRRRGLVVVVVVVVDEDGKRRGDRGRSVWGAVRGTEHATLSRESLLLAQI